MLCCMVGHKFIPHDTGHLRQEGFHLCRVNGRVSTALPDMVAAVVFGTGIVPCESSVCIGDGNACGIGELRQGFLLDKVLQCFSKQCRSFCGYQIDDRITAVHSQIVLPCKFILAS